MGRAASGRRSAKSVKVPEGAEGIALMPTLFNVKSGALAIRGLSVEAQEKYEELPEEKAAREEADRKRSTQWAARRAKARARRPPRNFAHRLRRSDTSLPPPRWRRRSDPRK